jgi:hypothetical protein
VTDPVREFLRLHLETLGAVVEGAGAELEVLLPPEVARAHAVDEEVRLVLDGGPHETAVDARLGSAFLERAVRSRHSRPAVAAVAVPGELPRALPDNIPVLLNAVRSGDVGPRTRGAERYLAAHLRLRLQGDEVRHAMLEVTVRLADGARVAPIDLASAYPVATSPLDGAEQRAAACALSSAVHRAAPAALASALEAIGRRARRDLLRMGEYYASLDADMARAIGRARSDDERARRGAKRALLPDELAARRMQLRERLAARLSAELVAAVVIETEVDRYDVPVRRRTAGGTVLIRRRAADGALEGPACAACGTSPTKLYLCDERLHPLCETCGRAGRLDHARCSGCRPHPLVPPAVVVEDASAPLVIGGDVEAGGPVSR